MRQWFYLHWNYVNVGSSATIRNKRHIEKIFEYIGFAPQPEYDPMIEDCCFKNPSVYCCKYSSYDKASGNIKESFRNMDEKDLLYLLNALFPKKNVYVHITDGNDIENTWENHDIIYDTRNMTRYCVDSESDYNIGLLKRKRSSKARFEFKKPKAEYVNALIDLSTEDGNAELTTLLLDLSQKLRDGLNIYEDNPYDEREIDKEYDIKEYEDYEYDYEE